MLLFLSYTINVIILVYYLVLLSPAIRIQPKVFIRFLELLVSEITDESDLLVQPDGFYSVAYVVMERVLSYKTLCTYSKYSSDSEKICNVAAYCCKASLSQPLRESIVDHHFRPSSPLNFK